MRVSQCLGTEQDGVTFDLKEYIAQKRRQVTDDERNTRQQHETVLD
jgi:hypothetical protein